MARHILSLIALFSFSLAQGQIYDDYIGAGHFEGVTVTASDQHQAFGWDEIASAQAHDRWGWSRCTYNGRPRDS